MQGQWFFRGRAGWAEVFGSGHENLDLFRGGWAGPAPARIYLLVVGGLMFPQNLSWVL